MALGCMPRAGIAESKGNPVLNLFRTGQTVFRSGRLHCVTSPSSVGGFQFLHILSNTCCHVVLSTAILVGVNSYLIVVLICVFLMANGVEYLFTCLLAVCVSSLEKCLFRSFAHFKLGYLSSVVQL